MILIFLRFVIGGSEDDWICVDGKWIEHGVPSAPKPIEFCGHKDIKVSSPKIDEEILSPLVIEGEARGSWFFEGDAPIRLLDGNGKGLVSAYISTQDIWTTDKFVHFKGGFEFEIPETSTGTLIFMKNNPSGLEENDEELRIPIRFKDFKKPDEDEEKICEDVCGDGECQEIVCQGTGCPCSESKDSCSLDCE